jgi:hypothetical protein
MVEPTARLERLHSNGIAVGIGIGESREWRDCTPMGLRLVLVLVSHVNGEGVVVI